MGHASTVWELAFDGEGRRMVSCSDDGALKIWACRKDAGACRPRCLQAGVRAGHGGMQACTPCVWNHCLCPDAFARQQGRRAAAPRAVPAELCPCPLASPCLEPLPAGQLRWQLLATLSGYHSRTIFTVDWSKAGLIASGCADNAIRIFGEAAAEGAAAMDEEAAAAAADAAAAEPGLRGLFMQQAGEQQAGEGGGGGSGAAGGSFRLLCTREQAHPLDVNCVRWHPSDATLLASAGDDCCVRLWRWRPAQT